MNKELWELYCQIADIKKALDNLQIKICKLCPKLPLEHKNNSLPTNTIITSEDYD